MRKFTHLHVHTRYSILDGAASIKGLIDKVKALGMDSLAITDHGNLYGVFEFYKTAKDNGIKPLLGCEMYVARGSRFDRDSHYMSGDHLILIAKNLKGYENLMKLSSLSFEKEAFYRTPRIDKELLFQYSEGLICSTACLGGILPQLILNGSEKEAEKILLEYKDVFKDDYYIELQRHNLKEQEEVNPVLIELATRNNVKIIATNDIHFIEKKDYDAHKILIYLNTGKTISDENKLMYSGEEYVKSSEQMEELFKDIPDAIENTQEIVNKVEDFSLERKPILPNFDIPSSFGSFSDFKENYPKEKIDEEYSQKEIEEKGGREKILKTKFETSYLRFLTYQGAKKRYGDPLSEDIISRIDYELKIMENMGFPGYFLIVQDFINYAQDKLNVIVGPGRGSAAGSVVAYCLNITTIDPIKYGLLFERFLNPERISMPDIDVDFDDEGRGRVLDYIKTKYGEDHVAQIITFGSMAAKNSIKDVARVLEMPLEEANKLTKMVPNDPKITLDKAYNNVEELKYLLENGSDLTKKVLLFARELEGSKRNVGVHACGVIIGDDDLSKYIPLSYSKDYDMPITQFEGSLVENTGMIKMDFLGLKTLSIIKDACENIKKNHQEILKPSQFPLDDEKTYELFQRGDTIGVFQFESSGMRINLQNLKPDRFEDLIAMNALYRPGPMQYIPNYIARKHGKEEIVYNLPIMEEFLKETYGITIYQEQVMLLSQKMANFTKGEADSLRKAMGKKKRDVMDKMKEKFIKGCSDNNLPLDVVNRTWEDWEKFAEYAFNKSHSTCYAFIAYQSAYIKAHYPAEFMASQLTHNLNDISSISFYIEEAQKHKIAVLGPDINESDLNFTVNKKGEIRFGLAAIKGLGESGAREIIEERENGLFVSVTDFVNRINLKSVNKRCIEALVKAGAFDSFENIHRAQFFQILKTSNNNEESFIERLIKYGNKTKANKESSTLSLFESEDEVDAFEIEFPQCEKWSDLEKLKNEKESIGFYLSGHPLDEYSLEKELFSNADIEKIDSLISDGEEKTINLIGQINSSAIKNTKTGNQFGKFLLEDKTASYEFALFGKDFVDFKNFLIDGLFVLVKAKIEKRGWGKEKSQQEEMQLKIKNIYLLNEVLESYGKEIILYIPIEKIKEGFSQEILNKIKATKIPKKENTGALVSLIIRDYDEDVDVTLRLKTDKISIKEFLKEVDDMRNEGIIQKYNIKTSSIK
ncbi:MAG: DNA polymerase III subunit alpha [Bacteroidales bacterium]|jgi:DNA polymerase-3 subunit alpha|nr:DNA polymerase III subunit alpha [Bacteroidales bacterium]